MFSFENQIKYSLLTMFFIRYIRGHHVGKPDTVHLRYSHTLAGWLACDHHSHFNTCIYRMYRATKRTKQKHIAPLHTKYIQAIRSVSVYITLYHSSVETSWLTAGACQNSHQHKRTLISNHIHAIHIHTCSCERLCGQYYSRCTHISHTHTKAGRHALCIVEYNRRYNIFTHTNVSLNEKTIYIYIWNTQHTQHTNECICNSFSLLSIIKTFCHQSLHISPFHISVLSWNLCSSFFFICFSCNGLWFICWKQ